MAGRNAFLVLAIAFAPIAACTTGEEEVRTEPAAMEEAEEEMVSAGESNIALQDTFPGFRAVIEPTGTEGGANAEAIIQGGAEATTVHIDLDGGEAGATYPWHIHSGNCGDASPPIVGAADAYPPIQVGDGGEGDSNATVGATLDPDGDYIINVHFSPARLDSIIACGEVVQSSALEY
jgi:hypothetical protein